MTINGNDLDLTDLIGQLDLKALMLAGLALELAQSAAKGSITLVQLDDLEIRVHETMKISQLLTDKVTQFIEPFVLYRAAHSIDIAAQNVQAAMNLMTLMRMV